MEFQNDGGTLLGGESSADAGSEDVDVDVNVEVDVDVVLEFDVRVLLELLLLLFKDVMTSTVQRMLECREPMYDDWYGSHRRVR